MALIAAVDRNLDLCAWNSYDKCLYSDVTFIFMIVGEWFNVDPEAVINQALQTGGGPNVSDAYTINGLPGPFYNCSSKGMKTSMFKHWPK